MKNGKNSLYTAHHYDLYTVKLRDMIVLLGETGGLLILFSGLFYDSLIPAFLLFLPAFILLGKAMVRAKIRKRKEQLKKEFLTEASLLGDFLRSGYSIENAIRETEAEILELYGPRSDMLYEIRLMGSGFSLNLTAEDVFRDFSARAGIDPIREFASVFSLINRTSGQIREIIKTVSDNLTAAFLVEEEIRTLTAARKTEQKIMNVMPLLILLYVRLASPDLLSFMYTTLLGRLVMTACLGLYALAYYWSDKIMDIHMEEGV